MTECERIINCGFQSKEFLKEETLDSFRVTENTKKIWLVELDILHHIHTVCEKYGLRYVLAAGSLIGAVRHNGYIPWDDDIDIVMPREDYEVFIRLQDEFTPPYFLQIPCQDSGYYYAMARVRNSRTTALDYPFMFQNFNHGMFIDVHPYDSADINSSRAYFMEIDTLIRKNSTAMRLNHPRLSARDKKRIAEYKREAPLKVYNKINGIIKSQRLDTNDYVAYYTMTTYGFEKSCFRRNWFSKRKKILFHGQETYIPIGYDDILKTTYGNYMLKPPVSQRKAAHGSVYFNPDKAYYDILEDIRQEVRNGVCLLWGKDFIRV